MFETQCVFFLAPNRIILKLIPQGAESGNPETVCQGDKNQAITSGGGFSERYAVPSFQKLHVQNYFTAAAALGQSPSGGYGTGRGYPDISLAGFNYLTYIGGKNFSVSGTSASCPAVAALFSNINAQRIANGKGSLGWINPVLYSNSSLFTNDITSGNTLCVSTGTCCIQGFYATPGWDPASGLGSVNYQKLADLFYGLGQYIPGSAITTGSPSIRPSSSPTVVPVPTLQPTVTPNYITLATFATTGDKNGPLILFTSLTVANLNI